MPLEGCRRSPERTQRKPADPPSPEITQRAFPCVHFSQLVPFLPPSVEGFRRVREQASSGKYGEVSVSEAERLFARADAEISVRIVDTTLAKLSDAIRQASEPVSQAAPAGAEALLQVGGSVGYVRSEAAEGKSEVNLLVADRFIVSVTSRGLEGTADVRRIANGLDIAGLSRLQNSPTSRE